MDFLWYNTEMSKRQKADAPKQVSDRETVEILRVAEQVLDEGLAGDLVELGCYRGDTSLLLERLLEQKGFKGKHEGDTFIPPAKRLWIYDSFEGLPERVAQDGAAAGTEFRAGELPVTKREVVEKIKRAGLRLPIIKKGFFENLHDEDLPEQICFAFLDGDLYTSIKTSLRLVTPRMARGGVILVHDFNNPQLPGVSKAVGEWQARNPGWQMRQVETLAIFMLK